MAREASKAKWRRGPKYKVQVHNRCEVCGRSRAYYRYFGLCRICLRERALRGELPGVVKASW